MEHSHLLRNLSNEPHVVLHNDERVIAIDFQNELCRPLDFRVTHTSGGFVQQYQRGVSCDYNTKLNPLPLTVSEQTDNCIAKLEHPDALEHFGSNSFGL